MQFQDSQIVRIASIGFALVMLLMILVSVSGIIKMHSNNLTMEEVFSHQHDITSHITRLRNIAHERIILAFVMLNTEDPIDIYEMLNKFRDLGSEFMITLDTVKASELTPSQQAALDDTMSLLNARASLLNKALLLLENNEIDQAKLILRDTTTMHADLIEKSNNILIRLFNGTKIEIESSSSQSKLTLVITLIVTVVVIIFAVMVAYFVIRHILRKETELFNEKEKALITLKSIDDAVIRTTSDKKISYLNPAAKELLGASGKDIYGKQPNDCITFYDVNSNEKIEHPFDEDVINQQKINGLPFLTYKNKENNKRPALVNIESAGIYDTENNLLGNVLVLHDVTDSHTAKEQLLMFNSTLEDKVKRRTNEILTAKNELQETVDRLKETQDQLIQSEKMAALGNLVAGISHEVNTPIGIGVTSASSLREETESIKNKLNSNTLKKSDLNSFVEHADQATNILLDNLRRASDLIKSFKQVAVDQSSEELRQINLREYVDEIILSLRPKLKNRPINVNNNINNDILLHIVPGAFYQILSNLILNSLIHAYDQNQEGLITLSAHAVDDHVNFKYADDGKGIASDKIDQIFNPFFTTRRGQGGSGLGMSIVYNLVTSTLHGVIDVSSELGNGTHFNMSFPTAA